MDWQIAAGSLEPKCKGILSAPVVAKRRQKTFCALEFAASLSQGSKKKTARTSSYR